MNNVLSQLQERITALEDEFERELSARRSQSCRASTYR
jgi:hypothetical protein